MESSDIGDIRLPQRFDEALELLLQGVLCHFIGIEVLGTGATDRQTDSHIDTDIQGLVFEVGPVGDLSQDISASQSLSLLLLLLRNEDKSTALKEEESQPKGISEESIFLPIGPRCAHQKWEDSRLIADMHLRAFLRLPSTIIYQHNILER